MVKKGLTDEQKEEQFNAWKESEEWKAMERYMEKREGIPLEISQLDICIDMQPYFDEIFALMSFMKVSKKAKKYEQQFIRTMYFKRLNDEKEVPIDGIMYEIPNECNVQMYKCREALYGIHGLFDEGRLQMEVTPDNYQNWKKELVKAMKAWDSEYMKHQKAKVYDKMASIHEAAMKPLTDLITANRNFNNIEKMRENTKDYNVPDFRFNALEEQFVKLSEKVFTIFKDFGDNRIELHFDIRQQLETLKIRNWKQIVPFHYYLQPLEDATKAVRDELLEMHVRGPLFIKYYVEENDELRNRTETMLKKDRQAQLLMGDELKQDQFKFFYDTCIVIYDSALCTKLVNEDKNVIQEVVPELIAYKAVMRIRDIQLTKHQEELKAKLKGEKGGAPGNMPSGKEEEKDPKFMTEEELTAKRLKDRENAADIGLTEDQLKEKEEAKERAKYGRFWVWEGYFNESTKDQWLETAEMLKHVNPHVLQDIEDSILLKGFGKEKPEKIKNMIELAQQTKQSDTLRLVGNTDNEDALQEQKKVDEKRRVLLPLRPSDKIWNFFEDCAPEEKTTHVLRYNAKPEASYCDGRIEKIKENLEQIAMNLKGHNDAAWEALTRNTLVVFKHLHKQHAKALENA